MTLFMQPSRFSKLFYAPFLFRITEIKKSAPGLDPGGTVWFCKNSTTIMVFSFSAWWLVTRFGLRSRINFRSVVRQNYRLKNISGRCSAPAYAFRHKPSSHSDAITRRLIDSSKRHDIHHYRCQPFAFRVDLSAWLLIPFPRPCFFTNLILLVCFLLILSLEAELPDSASKRHILIHFIK
jgi:hypothetical protein